MIKCTKCGTENEDSSKFCKSCGSVLKIAPQERVGVASSTSTIQTVKKIVVLVVAIIISIVAILVLVNYIQVQKREARITELRNGCANNDAKACYELVSSGILFDSDVPPDRNEINEALAKGCRLGNKDACREAGYYKQGCELRDGESCYLFAQDIHKANGIQGSVSCSMDPSGYECKLAKSFDEADIKHYLNLACEYEYSQGCIKQ